MVVDDVASALELLKQANAQDASLGLAAHLLVTELNAAREALEYRCIRSVASDAHSFLSLHPPGSGLTSRDNPEARSKALEMKDALETFNEAEGPCFAGGRP